MLASFAILQSSRARVWLGFGVGVGTKAARNLWKATKEIKLFRQPPEMAARDCAANDRPSGSAYDNVGHFVRHTFGIEAMGETEHPGSEILAAAAKHQRSVFTFSD